MDQMLPVGNLACPEPPADRHERADLIGPPHGDSRKHQHDHGQPDHLHERLALPSRALDRTNATRGTGDKSPRWRASRRRER